MPAPDLLKALPYFASLGSEEMARIAGKALELSFSRGEILFLEGELCRGLYVVKSGLVRIYKSSPEGREQVLMMARPGDSFNDVPLFDGGPNPASASAVDASTVYLIPKEIVLSLLAGCPPARAILKLFATRIRHLTTMVEDLSFRSVVGRLAKLLLDMAVVEGGRSPVKRLTQDEMAAMVGSVRDVIGRALKHMEKAGAIKIQGQRILVIAPERLKEMM
ncbi:MAG: Crp/Fnr family transcriptional regulator [Chloroflexi bacterium]|nr:Crp/Fnr family transcriptional regulator [Chloroflexota bacterium]